jgi:hypothetical protein
MPYKAQLAAHLIKPNPNNGIRTTSPNESSNFNIKSNLVSGRNNIFRLFQGIQEMVKNRDTTYKEQVTIERIKIQKVYLGQEYLGQLPIAISFNALEGIAMQKEMALKAVPSPACPHATMASLGHCAGESCTVCLQFGLPCRHLIATNILADKELTLADFDPHWHLTERLDELNPYTRIRNPLPAPPSRGRPPAADPLDADEEPAE